MAKLWIITLGLLLSACASNDDISTEAHTLKTKPMGELVKTLKEDLKTLDVSQKNKDTFIKDMKANSSMRATLHKEAHTLFSYLVVKNSNDPTFSLEKSREVVEKIKKIEYKIVDLKIEALKKLKIFVKDKIDAESRERMARNLSYDYYFSLY